MKEMTNEEADQWDEFFTKNPPTVDPSKKGGYFTRQRELLDVLDKAVADYILDRADLTHATPAQIIGQMVREKFQEKGDLSLFGVLERIGKEVDKHLA